VLGPDHPLLGEVLSAVGAGFRGSDEVGAPRRTDDLRDRLGNGTLRMVGAFGDDLAGGVVGGGVGGGVGGVVGGGSHAPRGDVTELTGIAVLPRARRRGVGAAITAALVQDAQAGGVRTVFLSADDERVADVYARVGFVRIGTACIAEAAHDG
jgi:GNAT superfamily N-acetyltransferase